MEEEKIAPPTGRAKFRWVVQLAGSTAVWAGALFGGAGRFDWPRGWIYCAAYVSMLTIAGVVVRRTNPDVIQARSRWRRADTKRFDKVFLAIFLPSNYILPAIGGMDNARFGWWPLPFGTVYPGVVLYAAAIALVTWVMAVNRFAESTVRIQTERGHTVVTTGPYRFVRHPMYVGAIFMMLATPLILGSMWALWFALVIAALFIARTALEDRTLQRELPGYEEYTARTRYRLLPGIW